MPSAQDRRYRPQLEALEDRRVLAPLIPFFPLRPASIVLFGSRSTAPLSGESAPAPTTVTPSAQRTVSIVPAHFSLGAFDRPAGVTPRLAAAGLFVRGMPRVFTRESDPGIAPPGIRIFSPSQPPRAPTVGGFQFTPEGVLFA